MRDIHKGQLNKRLFENKEAYKFKKGSTEWLKETEQIFKNNVEVRVLACVCVLLCALCPVCFCSCPLTRAQVVQMEA